MVLLVCRNWEKELLSLGYGPEHQGCQTHNAAIRLFNADCVTKLVYKELEVFILMEWQ